MGLSMQWLHPDSATGRELQLGGMPTVSDGPHAIWSMLDVSKVSKVGGAGRVVDPGLSFLTCRHGRLVRSHDAPKGVGASSHGLLMGVTRRGCVAPQYALTGSVPGPMMVWGADTCPVCTSIHPRRGLV